MNLTLKTWFKKNFETRKLNQIKWQIYFDVLIKSFELFNLQNSYETLMKKNKILNRVNAVNNFS